MKRFLSYFSKIEITLWCSSIALILISFIAFDRTNHLTLTASLIGVTSLIFAEVRILPWLMPQTMSFSLFYGYLQAFLKFGISVSLSALWFFCSTMFTALSVGRV